MDHPSAGTARARAFAMLEMFFSCKAMDDVVECSREPSSQKEMGTLALDNVFARLWARPQLDRRARSPLTPGILIALGSTDELKIHCIRTGRRNLSHHGLRWLSARMAVVDSLVKEGRITSEGYTDARRRTSDGRGDLLTNRQGILFDTPMFEAVERPTHPLATASSPAVACHCAAAASDHALFTFAAWPLCTTATSAAIWR